MNRRPDAVALLERLTGRRIHRSVPRGVSLFEDITHFLPAYRSDVVFDVGANVGQSSRRYLTAFPTAHIYAFEPVTRTFRELQANLGRNPRVECHHLGFGLSNSRATMVLKGGSDRFFMLDGHALPPDGAQTETVSVTTLDTFCLDHAIGRINFLKIDTEGRDLDVLKGSVRMLTERNIDLVQVEAGMNPGNSRHVPFESLKGFLETNGYFLFGIYDQVREWPRGEPHLRRTNPVFVSNRMIEMNRSSLTT